MAFVAIDNGGRITDWNAAAEQLFGWSRAEVIGREITETIIPPQRRAAHVSGLQRYLATGEHAILGRVVEVEARRRDGSTAFVALGVSAVAGAGGPYFTAFIVDLSERRAVEERLAQTEHRFRQAFDRAPIGMSVTTLDGVVIHANPALAEILGRDVQELVGAEAAKLIHPADRDANAIAMRKLAAGDLPDYRAEQRYLHADGHPVWVSLSASLIPDQAGRGAYFVSQIEDITSRKLAQDRLIFLADHDPLSGLLNRRRFELELERALDHRRRYEHALTLLVLDLDNFKHINDTLGHAAGDEAIVRAARLLSERLRRTDVLARIGGDEFAAILPEATTAQINTVARDLLEVIRRVTVGTGTEQLALSASVGIAVIPPRTEIDAAEVLQRADAALYEAKRSGRDTYRLVSHGRPTGPRPVPQVTLEEVLAAIDEFGTASVGLIAWEFMVGDEQLRPVWRAALEQGLIRLSGPDPNTGEPTYELTLEGDHRIADARRREAGDSSEGA